MKLHQNPTINGKIVEKIDRPHNDIDVYQSLDVESCDHRLYFVNNMSCEVLFTLDITAHGDSMAYAEYEFNGE